MIEAVYERKSLRELNGRYLLVRQPQIGERVFVINHNNKYFGEWGVVVDKIPEWDTFGVQMDNKNLINKLETGKDPDSYSIVDFYRFEIAWDSGH